MTTFTDLSAGAVGVGGIPSGSTVTALRDNPIAIAEGSSGAPRIYGLAAARPGNGLPVVTISAANTVNVIESTEFEQVIGGTFTTTSLVTVLRFTMSAYAGAARFRALTSVGRIGTEDPQYTSYTWYWKVDGVTIATAYYPTSSGSTVPSKDITFTAGQVITLEIDINSSRGYGIGVTPSSVTSNVGYVPQTLFKLNSE